MKNRFKKKCF